MLVIKSAGKAVC